MRFYWSKSHLKLTFAGGGGGGNFPTLLLIRVVFFMNIKNIDRPRKYDHSYITIQNQLILINILFLNIIQNKLNLTYIIFIPSFD